MTLARLGLAESLLGRGQSSDRDGIDRLLSEVERDASAMGMRPTVARVQRVRERISGGARTEADNIWRPEGDVWTIHFQGRTVVMPNAKGLHDLRALLAQPGKQIAVAELLNPFDLDLVTAARHATADPVLDAQARAAYRSRIKALDEQLAAALAGDDDERACSLDLERAALLEELRSATGLGGRTRRLGDVTERARKTVTARIRDTLRRLELRHPELADHLGATISTGATCCYLPDRAVTWLT